MTILANTHVQKSPILVQQGAWFCMLLQAFSDALALVSLEVFQHRFFSNYYNGMIFNKYSEIINYLCDTILYTS